MKSKILVIICIVFSVSFSSVDKNKFVLKKEANSISSIRLEHDIDSMIEIDGYKKIINNTNSHTIDPGFPELPTYTAFYQLDIDKEYEISMEVHDSYIIENIKIAPYKDENTMIIDDLNFYLSSQVYPINNFYTSDRMHSRGVDVITIEVIPFSYSAGNNTLEVFTDLEIIINEIGNRQDSINRITKRSKTFDSLLQEFIINFETSSRDEDYQIPSILYICGGSSSNSSYFQELIEWRHQQGYIVNIATLSETGSSANSIKNYIEDAYFNWENPPEYVALVGDVGGSYTLPTFYDGFGHNSYGNDCEGDLPYSQLDGNDFIPEVIVGRISVRSSNEIGVVVAKTIAYEKASYIDITGTDWYEGAALVGDPSSSGQSTIHTNQYIDNILHNHGFEDIETAYSGDYDGFMEDRLEEGISYLNYRGYLGVSNFDGNDINGANNGYMTPFSTILTCGTGSFAEDNTSLSEAMLRYGSVSNPKGAVALHKSAWWGHIQSNGY